MRSSIKSLVLISIFASSAALADSLTLTSKDIAEGEFMSKNQEFEGFGCAGGNTSPQLSWSGAPEGTESFAVLVHDPDAPTGSGWWHWQLVNIPKDVTSIAANTGGSDKSLLPEGSSEIGNDYGFKGFGGACPPKGHGVHRYQFTLHALSTKLELPEGASGALAGFMVTANSLASSTLEALYRRD